MVQLRCFISIQMNPNTFSQAELMPIIVFWPMYLGEPFDLGNDVKQTKSD